MTAHIGVKVARQPNEIMVCQADRSCNNTVTHTCMGVFSGEVDSAYSLTLHTQLYSNIFCCISDVAGQPDSANGVWHHADAGHRKKLCNLNTANASPSGSHA